MEYYAESLYLNWTSNHTNFTYNDYDNSGVMVELWLVPTIFALICLVGVIGNSLVIVVIIRHKQMKTTTNFYILSVAITDLVFLVICVPFTALSLVTEWVVGDFMCKLTFYLIFVVVEANCFTLTAMTIDRYCVIVHSMASMGWRRPKVVLAISCIIWLVSASVNIPVAMFRRVEYVPWYMDEPMPYCMETWPNETTWPLGFFLFGLIATYCVPLAVIVICNCMVVRHIWKSSQIKQCAYLSGRQRLWEKRRVRTTKMICVVAILFGVSWLPVHILAICSRMAPAHFTNNETAYYAQLTANCLAYSNSCMNPFVYAFMGSNFKRCFKEVFANLFYRRQYKGANIVLSECPDSVHADSGDRMHMSNINNHRQTLNSHRHTISSHRHASNSHRQAIHNHRNTLNSHRQNGRTVQAAHRTLHNDN
ncbi:G-protein coupled receptor 54-like [Saccoglossus kowalevskii]